MVNSTGTTEDVNAASPMRANKTERQNNEALKNGRVLHDKDKLERFEDRPERLLKKADRDRTEKLPSALRQTKEQQKPDDREEISDIRRQKKSDAPPANRSGRHGDSVDERATTTARRHEPEWLSGDPDEYLEHDDPTGKTVDDFERWKQSMKKNDGSGDIGLPPLIESSAAAAADADSHNEGVAKDVKPPPGFGSPARSTVPDHMNGSTTHKSFFGLPSPGEAETPVSGPAATQPPGLSSSKKLPVSIQNASVNGKAPGSSKFSKFFNSNQGVSQSQPQPSTSKEVDHVSHTSNGNDIFAALSGAKSASSKDDAEGFERILAMLSSQTAPARSESHLQSASHQRSAMQSHVQPPSSQQQGPSNDHHPMSLHQQSSTQLYGGHVDRLNSQQVDQRSNVSNHVSREPNFQHPPTIHHRAPPHGTPSYERPYEQGPYSPERQAMPAMRDMSTGSGSIMYHHTQNHDFFSSLLKQSQTSQPGVQFSNAPSHERLNSSLPLSENRPQPHSRQQPLTQRHHNTTRFAEVHPQPHHGSTNVDEQQHLHFLRQQQAANLQHQSTQGTRARNAAEMDFVDQLMAEQRLTSGSLDYAQYTSRGHVPQGMQYGTQRRIPLQQGFVTGVGAQPVPGWNGQFEIDPRIPNASQYRP